MSGCYSLTNFKWTLSTNMTIPRSFAAAVWDEEKVLVSGGDGKWGRLNSTEWFDGIDWSAGPDLPYHVESHCMVRLPGTWDLLLIGGFKKWAGEVSDTYLYNTTTAVWTKMASMNKGRAGHACSVMPSGEVWVAGRRNAAYFDDLTVEIYTVETNSWQRGPDLPYASDYPGEFLMDGVTLFYVGGDGRSDIHKLNKEQNGWIFVRV